MLSDKKIVFSPTDSFHFLLRPNYFKVEHAFAKNIKPNTTYRLAIFKGVQKCDEMVDSIKSKLVGGKILFDDNLLNFNLSIYSPSRNIQFTLKIYETKPNEQQTQIASTKIKSGDFIKSLKNDSIIYVKQEVNLLDSLVLVFELFTHNSKIQLDKIYKQFLNSQKQESRKDIIYNRGKTPKKNQTTSEVHSQSDKSESHSNQGAGFFSGRKRLVRKRGHQGQLKSRNASRENSDVQSDDNKSMRSSQRKKFVHSPPTKKQQHYLHTPKKASPPKVQERQNSPKIVRKNQTSPKNYPNAQSNKNVLKKQSNNSVPESSPPKQQINYAKPLPSQIERSQSTKKANKAKDIQMASSNIEKKFSLASNQSSNKNIHNLEFKGNEKIFELEKKNVLPSKSIGNSNTKIILNQKQLPNPKSKTINTQQNRQKIEASKSQKSKQIKKQLASPLEKKPTQIHNLQFKPTEKIFDLKNKLNIIKDPNQNRETILEQKKQKIKSNNVSQQAQNKTQGQNILKDLQKTGQSNQQPKISSVEVEKSVQSQKKNIQSPIAIKIKPLLISGESQVKMKQSIRRTSQNWQNNEAILEHEQAKKQFEGVQNKIFYIVFIITSIVLLYNALTPSKKC